MPGKERMVDALEDGKIVRVSESYALREGLIVLRRQQDAEPPSASTIAARRVDDVKIAPFETLRKPLPKHKNAVISSLVDNFHWIILEKRRSKHLTRKQFADALGASEHEIKLIENGVLPSDDYILISKAEKYLGVNLRKDGSSFNPPKFSYREKREGEVQGAHKYEDVKNEEDFIDLDDES